MSKHFLVVGLTCLLSFGGSTLGKEPITEGEKSAVMLDLDPYMIDALYGADAKGQTGRFGAEGGLADLLKEPKFAALIQKHDLKLFNGPMLGDVRPTSAKFWVRTAGSAEVQIVVGERKSQVVTTDAREDFTAVLEVDRLQPFTEYPYEVRVDGKPIQREAFRFRTAPEPGQKAKFHVTFGSGARYVPVNEHAWSTMAKQRPLAYLGLGDNVYIDVMHRRGAQRLFYYRRYLSPRFQRVDGQRRDVCRLG